MVDNKKFDFITNFVFGCKITNYFQLNKILRKYAYTVNFSI